MHEAEHYQNTKSQELIQKRGNTTLTKRKLLRSEIKWYYPYFQKLFIVLKTLRVQKNVATLFAL